METIPNDSLRLEHLPASDAYWPEVWRLASTFNGYEHWGSFERCADVANQRQGSTLIELRACLFFERRRWRHFGYDPTKKNRRTSENWSRGSGKWSQLVVSNDTAK